jgi:hypothetical protein
MRRLFFVDREMCGGDDLPAEFDLEGFCEVLQGKVSDVEIVPANDTVIGTNREPWLVSEHQFQEALGEYSPR